MPTAIKDYRSFIGGGAVLFELQPKNAGISDFNEELMNMYSLKTT